MPMCGVGLSHPIFSMNIYGIILASSININTLQSCQTIAWEQLNLYKEFNNLVDISSFDKNERINIIKNWIEYKFSTKIDTSNEQIYQQLILFADKPSDKIFYHKVYKSCLDYRLQDDQYEN